MEDKKEEYSSQQQQQKQVKYITIAKQKTNYKPNQHRFETQYWYEYHYTLMF